MSINSKMTAIADEIRELSGTAAPMGLDAMASNLNTANGNISTETDLIAQITTALEGKAGSGGGSVETCTVTISGASNGSWLVTKYVNGEFVVEYSSVSNGTHENVVCGSGIYVSGIYLSYAASTGTVLYGGSGFYYQAPMTPGATVTISLEQD